MIILLQARHQMQLTTPAHMERVSSRVGKTLQQPIAYPFSAASSLAILLFAAPPLKTPEHP